MKIKLTEKYRPFSHEVGTSCLLPKSSWKVKAYPTQIEFTNLLSEGSRDHFLVTCAIQGPLSQFTVMQDLERQWVRVLGKGPQGYFSYRLVASAHEVILFLERAPKEGIPFTYEGETRILKRKEELIMPSASCSFPNILKEKIHFGCHKAQDWTLVKRRLNLEEILPIWFELGKNIPSHPKLDIGTARLLKHCETLALQKKREEIGIHLIGLFRAGFEGILTPRLIDTDYQGFLSMQDEIPKEASPLMLLGEGARLIRQLFIQQKENKLSLLPCLPVELHAGRFVGVECKDLTLDIEWTKKLIRRLSLRPQTDQVCYLKFQSPLKSFRLRKGPRDRGRVYEVGTPLQLSAGTTYTLDRFQK